jgi:hypothetical protein
VLIWGNPVVHQLSELQLELLPPHALNNVKTARKVIPRTPYPLNNLVLID